MHLCNTTQITLSAIMVATKVKNTAVNNEFLWSFSDEPHASRRRQILVHYPQIRQLFGPDPFSLLKVHFLVYFHFSLLLNIVQ